MFKPVLKALLGVTLVCFGPSASFAGPQGKTTSLLAASWEPAFCEGKSGKPECKSQTADRFDASHFSLHGLWPMRKDYCNVSKADIEADKTGRWDDLPAVTLSAETEKALEKVMPGTQSGLQKHEWLRHGTCTGLSQEDYFKSAISLMDDLNTSAVQALFASHIGKEVTQSDVQAAFDKSFGDGAAERVKMHCEQDGDRRLVTELTIGLGDGTADASLKDRIASAGRTRFDCDRGIVDPVGQQ
ncbi:ribonuclease T2 [Allorhizobium sp. BGMRC 0089]|uniref:ribonuclease T2 n=1 Tax=Allorhizobium sonneratiae TaxID=2934936 RepID=UPI0020341A65|nr:ribonuclease T2 [Allorhizobium sonneratiae]MCM2294187.1 ribonuclease T2 [Allorhizobium sonneratiae]